MKLSMKAILTLSLFMAGASLFADPESIAARIYIENDSNQVLNLKLATDNATPVPDLHSTIPAKTGIEVYAGGFNFNNETGANVELLATFGNTPSGYHTSKLSVLAARNQPYPVINVVKAVQDVIWPDNNTRCQVKFDWNDQAAYFYITNCLVVNKASFK